MSQELETLIGDLVEASPGGAPPHPAPRRLLDYHGRRLSEASAAEVREHLVRCRACAAALVDLGELERSAVESDEAEPAEEAADYGTAASWRALAPLLAEASPEPVAEAPGSSGSSSSGSSGSWWPRLAAALVLVTLGLGIWSMWLWSSRHALEGRLARFEAPQANAEAVYLDALMRSDSAPPQISPRAGRVMIFLTPPEQPEAAAYRVEIRDSSERLLAEIGGLVPQDLGALRFSLSAGSLGPGSHRVLLFEEGGSDRLAAYALDVAEPSASASSGP